MSVSLYQVSVPGLVRALNALAAILDKAAAHAEARKIDPLVLTATRLTPDMFPLARQVMLATDFAKGCGARLAGIEVPKYDDVEKSIPDLKARIAKTVKFLAGLKPDQFAGAEDRKIVMKIAGEDTTLDATDYLVHTALPNFYFHVTTAYDILRQCGVDIGKRDFIGQR